MNDPVVPKKTNRIMRRRRGGVGRNRALQIDIIKKRYLAQLLNYIHRRREKGGAERLADLRRAFAHLTESNCFKAT